MKYDINDFVIFDRLKNGSVKIKHNITNEGNIYELLHKLGYCKTKLDRKNIYYQRTETDLFPTSFLKIKLAFRDFLKNENFKNLPENISSHDILNWFYVKNPIKENGLFDHYLEDNLIENDIHVYRLKKDCDYKHKFEVQQLISKFEEWNFCKTIDTVGEFFKDCPLYFKNIGYTKYLIFIHFTSKNKMDDIFECCIATYTNEKYIGIKKPLNIQEIQANFQLDKDFHLIIDYIK
jgi:hypothetical protein